MEFFKTFKGFLKTKPYLGNDCQLTKETDFPPSCLPSLLSFLHLKHKSQCVSKGYEINIHIKVYYIVSNTSFYVLSFSFFFISDAKYL